MFLCPFLTSPHTENLLTWLCWFNAINSDFPQKKWMWFMTCIINMWLNEHNYDPVCWTAPLNYKGAGLQTENLNAGQVQFFEKLQWQIWLFVEYCFAHKKKKKRYGFFKRVFFVQFKVTFEPLQSSVACVIMKLHIIIAFTHDATYWFRN